MRSALGSLSKEKKEKTPSRMPFLHWAPRTYSTRDLSNGREGEKKGKKGSHGRKRLAIRMTLAASCRHCESRACSGVRSPVRGWAEGGREKGATDPSSKSMRPNYDYYCSSGHRLFRIPAASANPTREREKEEGEEKKDSFQSG